MQSSTLKNSSCLSKTLLHLTRPYWTNVMSTDELSCPTRKPRERKYLPADLTTATQIYTSERHPTAATVQPCQQDTNVDVLPMAPPALNFTIGTTDQSAEFQHILHRQICHGHHRVQEFRKLQLPCPKPHMERQ